MLSPVSSILTPSVFFALIFTCVTFHRLYIQNCIKIWEMLIGPDI